MIKYSNNVVLNKIYNWLDRLIGYSDGINASEVVDEEEQDYKGESFCKIGQLSQPGDLWD